MLDLEKFAENSRRRIDCPISWCEGSWFDHGGEGQAPAAWSHTGEYLDLRAGLPRNCRAFVHQTQWGSGPAEWSGHIEISPELFEDSGPAGVVATLRGDG